MGGQAVLKVEVALTRPQLVEELFEIRSDKQLYCRYCGKLIDITCYWEGGKLLSTYMQCGCPRSEKRIKVGVIKTAEVVKETRYEQDPFPEGDEGEDQIERR